MILRRAGDGSRVVSIIMALYASLWACAPAEPSGTSTTPTTGAGGTASSAGGTTSSGGGSAGGNEPTSCVDNTQNGNETGVDCGGNDCPACQNGESCLSFSDCESKFCDAGTCAPCASQSDCAAVPNSWCSMGDCVNQKMTGEPCGEATECLTGYCPEDDDVCCDSACAATCEACTVAKTGSTDGICAAILVGTDPDSECPGTDTCTGTSQCQCADNTLNGVETDVDCGGGTCATCSNAKTCNTDNDCTSAFCVDGVCCNGACAGTCEACNLGSTLGMCVPHAAGTDPDNECAGAETCNGFALCACSDGLLNGNESDVDCGGGICPPCATGEICLVAGDCVSSFCTDGTCCDSACNGTCEACDLPTSVGSCVLVPSGQDPDNECVQSTNCNGNGACTLGAMWSLTFGDYDDRRTHGLAVEAGGTMILAGSYTDAAFEGVGPGFLGGRGGREAFVAKVAPNGNVLWAKSYIDDSSVPLGFGVDQEARDVAVDLATNVVVVGHFRGMVDFGNGPVSSAGGNSSSDIFVLKLTPTGSYSWSTTFGDAGDDVAQRVALDGSDIVIAGIFTGSLNLGGPVLTSFDGYDVFVAKLAANGAHIWSRSFPGLGDAWVGELAIDASGNVGVAGGFAGDIDAGLGSFLSAGGTDAFAAKLDAGGTTVWADGYGDGQNQEAAGVSFDAAGNLVLAGSFSGNIGLGGAPLTSAGGLDIFVATLDAFGAHLWSTSYGNAGSDEASHAFVDALGRILLTGRFEGQIDFGGGPLVASGAGDVFVAALSSTGAHLWSRRFGDSSEQRGDQIGSDSSGNVAVAGGFAGELSIIGSNVLRSAGGEDTFLGHLSATGSDLWGKRFPYCFNQRANDLSVGAGSDFAIAGTSERLGTDLGGGKLPQGAFVAKLDGSGGHLWSKGFVNAYARGVAAGADGRVATTGGFSYTSNFGAGPVMAAGFWDDIYVAALDANGNHLWSHTFGDIQSGDSGYDVAFDSSNNVVVVGTFSGVVDFGGGPLTSWGDKDGFVAKFDAAGAPLWSMRFGDSLTDAATEVAVDSSDNIVVSGFVNGTVDFGGGPLQGGGFVVKLSATGQHVWSDGNSSNEPAHVDVGPADEILLARQGLVRVYESNGAVRWSKGYTLVSVDAAFDPNGDVLISGCPSFQVDFGGGILLGYVLAKVGAATGQHVSSRSISNAPCQAGYPVPIESDGLGNALVGGSFINLIDFGLGIHYAACLPAVNGDGFVAKLSL